MSAENTIPQQANQNDDLHLNKVEKKARKAMEKLGLSPVTGIARVVFRRPKGMMLAVTEPQVYKSADDLTYVVLGEAKVEDLNQQAQLAAQDRLRLAENQPSTEAAAPAEVEADDNEEQDDTGLDAKDIELIIQQAGVSRNKAIKTLRENDNDLVNAIMALTT